MSKAKYAVYVSDPNGWDETFTIQEAAEKWISMILDPATKATPEQKEALICSIRAAVPNTRWVADGTRPGVNDGPNEKGTFTDACNNIKRVIRAAQGVK